MKKLLPIIILLILFVAGIFAWYSSALEPISASDDRRIPVKIEKGSSVSEIAETLEERGLIRSSLSFRLYTRLNGLDSSLQAGHFVLKKQSSVPELAEILQSGKAEEMIVTIPEGFTVTDIDATLSEKGLIEAGSFIDCARTCDLSEFAFLPDPAGLAERGGQVEGYLYPDTYFVLSENFGAESFLRRLLSTFEKKVVTGLDEYLQKSDRSLHQIVTMASLIEEEAATDEERYIISGILWKRYDAERGLGVDATTRYIVNKPTQPLTVQDLNSNDPYNTRKLRGLPPGPIASPGYESILSAISPKDSKYWYYLHDPEGQIHYAETNNEHNLNRQKYL